MKDFNKIKAWQKAHFLNLDIYKVTKNFPKEEMYRLILKAESRLLIAIVFEL